MAALRNPVIHKIENWPFSCRQPPLPTIIARRSYGQTSALGVNLSSNSVVGGYNLAAIAA
jgi:hypothetical protein